jgi:Fe2+ or Zn2+ uptake regulation protein
VTKTRDAETVFDLLGNELVREMLVMTSPERLSAEEIAARCSASQPTVYRRLDSLEEYDLVGVHTEYDDEGNHYQSYECRLDEARFSIEDGGFTIDLTLRRDPVGEADLPDE